MTSTRELFARHNLRCTSKRQMLYDALAASCAHPTAEELYRMVRPAAGHLSRATVYNTLEALCEVGLVRKLPSNGGCCRYDADTTDHLHVCFREDGVLEDVPKDLADRMAGSLPTTAVAELEERLGIRIDARSAGC